MLLWKKNCFKGYGDIKVNYHKIYAFMNVTLRYSVCCYESKSALK
jgi:hypothetical protein